MKRLLVSGAVLLAVVLIARHRPLPARSPMPDAASGPVPRQGARPELPRPPTGRGAEAPAAVSRTSIADWKDEETRARPLAALLKWSSSEPEACLAWVRTLPEDLSSSLLAEISGSLIAENPEAATRFIEEMTPGPVADAMLRQAAMEYATRSPDQAMEWAMKQPEAENRDLLLSAVLVVMSGSDPRRAADEASHLVGTERRNLVLVEISQRWAQQDLKKASAFVAAQPPEVAIPAAVQIVGRWPGEDLASCVTWISSLPESGRAEVLSALISRPQLQTREKLEELMNSTKDPALVAVIREMAASR